MPIDHQRLYSKFSALGAVRLAFQAWREKRPLQKRSLLNRQQDYVSLANRPDLLALHGTINAILAESRAWPHYDYGEGYFYQSFKPAGIRGFRDTEARVAAMDLKALIRGKSVLDIGCNCGFVAMSIAADAASVAGMDVNPYLVRIGQSVAAHFGISNVSLTASSFEDWPEDQDFDVVMSFANHSTFDEQTRQSVVAYLEKCSRMLRDGGILLFESHAPDFEGEKLVGVIEAIGSIFEIESSDILDYGSFLDTGRTFVIARKR